MDLDLELDNELEDFELALPDYNVWALGFTASSAEAKTEQLLATFEDPDEAITFIESLSVYDVLSYGVSSPEQLDRFSLEVETTVSEGDVGVIFRKCLPVNIKEFFDIHVKEADLKFTEEGILCVINSTYPVGTLLRIHVHDNTADHKYFYTGIYKVLSCDVNGILCESELDL